MQLQVSALAAPPRDRAEERLHLQVAQRVSGLDTARGGARGGVGEDVGDAVGGEELGDDAAVGGEAGPAGEVDEKRAVGAAVAPAERGAGVVGEDLGERLERGEQDLEDALRY